LEELTCPPAAARIEKRGRAASVCVFRPLM